MSMTLAGVPDVVKAYLAADAAGDADALALCFDEDGLVHDEAHDYRGRNAIRSWNTETKAKYRYTLEPLDASAGGDVIRLGVRLTGEFPGSPVEVDYTFTLANDKIASLTVD